MIDPDWAKWIHASIAKHFSDAANTAGLVFHFEGDVNRVGVDNQEDWVELRIDGPDYYPAGNDRWRANVEVNVLVGTIVAPEKNLYANVTNCGVIAQAMTRITIVNYDTSGIIACLTPNDDRVETNYFGQVQARTDLIQATVEAHYDTILVGA